MPKSRRAFHVSYSEPDIGFILASSFFSTIANGRHLTTIVTVANALDGSRNSVLSTERRIANLIQQWRDTETGDSVLVRIVMEHGYNHTECPEERIEFTAYRDPQRTWDIHKSSPSFQTD